MNTESERSQDFAFIVVAAAAARATVLQWGVCVDSRACQGGLSERAQKTLKRRTNEYKGAF